MIKKPVGRPKKAIEDVQDAVHGTESEKTDIAPAPVVKELEIAMCKCFRYSEECPMGRIFNVGDVVPDGWVDSPAKLKG